MKKVSSIIELQDIAYLLILISVITLLNLGLVLFSGTFFSLVFTNELPSVIDQFIEPKNFEATHSILVITCTLYVTCLVLYGICNVGLLNITYNQEAKVGLKVFKQRLTEKIKTKKTSDEGEIVKNIIQEPARVTHGYIVPLMHVISKSAQAFVTIVFLLFQDIKLTLVAITVLGISYYVIKKVTSRPMVLSGANCVELNKGRFNVVQNSIAARKEILVYSLQTSFLKKYGKINKNYVHELFKCDATATIPRYFLELVIIIMLLAVVLFQASNAITDDPQKMFLFGGAALRIIPLLQAVYHSSTMMSFNEESLKVVQHELKEEGDNRIKSLPLIFNAILGVSTSEERIIIIEGVNGSGKTTLLDCLSEINDSEMKVDPAIQGLLSIKDKKPTYVTQFPALIDGNILSNIDFSDAGVLESKALEICNFFGLSSTSNVDNLSGGQRQLVSIVRAITNSNGYILMDEPTSALDLNKKELLKRYIEEDLDNRYVIITHDQHFRFKAQTIINLTTPSHAHG